MRRDICRKLDNWGRWRMTQNHGIPVINLQGTIGRIYTPKGVFRDPPVVNEDAIITDLAIIKYGMIDHSGYTIIKLRYAGMNFLLDNGDVMVKIPSNNEIAHRIKRKVSYVSNSLTRARAGIENLIQKNKPLA